MENSTIILVLTFCRVMGFMQMMPPLGELKLPLGIRFVTYLGITPFIAGASFLEPPELTVALFSMEFLFLVSKEMLLGLFLGFLVSLPLRLPQMMGDLIDNQRGTAVTSQYNPSSGDESSVLGQLLMLSVVAYFFSEGGFEQLIGILTGSLVLQPVHTYGFFAEQEFFPLAVTITTHYLQLFAILALPIVAVLLVIDASLGMSSKFANALNAFSLSQPIKAVVAIFMLISIHPKIVSGCMQFMGRVGELVG